MYVLFKFANVIISSEKYVYKNSNRIILDYTKE